MNKILTEQDIMSLMEDIVVKILNESEDDSDDDTTSQNKIKKAIDILNNPMLNRSELIRLVERPSSKEEEDTLRSIYAKYASGALPLDPHKAQEILSVAQKMGL